MSYPVVQDYRTNQGFDVGSITVARPNGAGGVAPVAGDLLILQATVFDNAGTTLSASGFTELDNQLDITLSIMHSYIWTREADGTEGSNFTVTLSSGTQYVDVSCLCLTNADVTTFATAVSKGYNDPQTIPAITTIANESLVLCYKTGYGHTITSGPTVYTIEVNYDTTIYIMDLLVSTAGLVTADSIDMTSTDSYIAHLIAVSPPGGSPPIINLQGTWGVLTDFA